MRRDVIAAGGGTFSKNVQTGNSFKEFHHEHTGGGCEDGDARPEFGVTGLFPFLATRKQDAAQHNRYLFNHGISFIGVSPTREPWQNRSPDNGKAKLNLQKRIQAAA